MGGWVGQARVRYIVDSVEAALPFYESLGFEVRMHPAPGFAALDRGGLRLLLNEPGAGGAGQAMPDGRSPEPGGWARLQLPVEDLEARVRELEAAGVRFRGGIIDGKGGRQILAEDPSGNAVELFEATAGAGRPSVEEIAREFIQVWTAGNLDLLDRLAHEELVVTYSHFPEPVEGPSAFRAVLEQTFHQFPDLRTVADRVIGRGEEAAVEWHYEGTHEHGELFGVEPTGRRVRVQGITLYRIRDGRVVEERGVVDVLGLMAQVGALDGQG